MNDRKRWLVVCVYAVAMAWVEAAVVLYLRTMFNRIEPYQPNPMPMIGGLASVEIAREAATLVMLLTVGILAGNNLRSRLGHAAMAFGVWDIFYYMFLKVMCGWPKSLFDWDILFLIPLPWWGPVLAPVSISLLLIIWGALASRSEPARAPTRSGMMVVGMAVAGMGLGLAVFMADALAAAPHGSDAVRNVLPKKFNWVCFGGAWLLMAAPVLHLLRPSQSTKVQPVEVK